jgi:hypothetical protein
MRTVEREVKSVEEEIRRQYPAAQYIELEPDSTKTSNYAIDEGRVLEADSHREIATINEMEEYIRKTQHTKKDNKLLFFKKKKTFR